MVCSAEPRSPRLVTPTWAGVAKENCEIRIRAENSFRVTDQRLAAPLRHDLGSLGTRSGRSSSSALKNRVFQLPRKPGSAGFTRTIMESILSKLPKLRFWVLQFLSKRPKPTGLKPTVPSLPPFESSGPSVTPPDGSPATPAKLNPYDQGILVSLISFPSLEVSSVSEKNTCLFDQPMVESRSKRAT